MAETAPFPAQAAAAPGAEGAVPVPAPALVDGAAAPEGQVAAGAAVGAAVGAAPVLPAPAAVPAHRAPTPVPVSANVPAQQPLTTVQQVKASGPRVFGVHLSRDKALQAQLASFPRFCIVAAEPDVSVQRDPARNAVEIRRINTVSAVHLRLSCPSTLCSRSLLFSHTPNAHRRFLRLYRRALLCS